MRKTSYVIIECETVIKAMKNRIQKTNQELKEAKKSIIEELMIPQGFWFFKKQLSQEEAEKELEEAQHDWRRMYFGYANTYLSKIETANALIKAANISSDKKMILSVEDAVIVYRNLE